MKKNMGYTDKIIRLLAAFIILFLIWFGQITDPTWQIIALVVALVFAATSFFEVCPLYSVFGICTRKECKKEN